MMVKSNPPSYSPNIPGASHDAFKNEQFFVVSIEDLKILRFWLK
jgi:hypothetical protein